MKPKVDEGLIIIFSPKFSTLQILNIMHILCLIFNTADNSLKVFVDNFMFIERLRACAQRQHHVTIGL